jgi:hypothetical protein
MVEKKRTGPLNPLELALELSLRREEGPAGLVIALYEQYRARFSENGGDGKGQKAGLQPEDVIKSQMNAVLTNPQSRALIFTELSVKLIKRVEKAQRVEREQRQVEIITAFGYYALLAEWLEAAAEESGTPLTKDEGLLLVALQKIIDSFN